MNLRPLLSALLVSGLAAGAQAATVLSDDFETGQINGGSSQYTAVPDGTFTSPGDYGVVSDPSVSFTNGYASQFDHTLGSADGHMLFFDGAPSSSTQIWTQSAQLTAGVSYTFSYDNVWVQALAPRPLGTDAVGGNPNAPLTQLLIDGTAAGGSLEALGGNWSGSAYTFTADHTGAYNFAIVDLNTQGDMNDGALDDIRLVTSAVPEPASGALLLAGLAGLATFARRRPQG